MFLDVDADISLMAYGDGTFDYRMAPEMTQKLIVDHLDMVVGTRQDVNENAHRAGHGFENRLFNGWCRSLFRPRFSDIHSGYHIFARRFFKSFPAVSSRFEVENEMFVHTSQLRMPIAEIPAQYCAPQEGSVSKLHTVRDGLRTMFTFLILFKEIRSTRFFGVLAIALSLIAVSLSTPRLLTHLETGLVPRFPIAILAIELILLSGIFLVRGLILDSVARGRLEQKRMWYVANIGKYK